MRESASGRAWTEAAGAVQAGVQPDTAIYNSVMRQQAAAGLGPGALQATVADMEAHGQAPDRRSFFVLLRAFSREGDLAGAMHVMHRMAQLGALPAQSLEDVKGHPIIRMPDMHTMSVCQALCVSYVGNMAQLGRLVAMALVGDM